MRSSDSDKSGITVVSCPHCSAQVSWDAASPFRPFCSRRCRLIDLGEWFNEEKRIPGDDVDADDLPAEEHDPERHG